MRRLLVIFAGLALVVGACSSDSSDSDDGSSDQTVGADAGGDGSDDDGGDSAAPDPDDADHVLDCGIDGVVAITVTCGDPGRGIVLFQLTGGAPDTTIEVEAGEGTGSLAIGPAGAGAQGLGTDAADGTAAIVHFPSGAMEVELSSGC